MILGSEGQGLRLMLGFVLLPVDQKLFWNAAGVTEYISSPSHLHNMLSNENMKWYFHDTSYKSWPMV